MQNIPKNIASYSFNNDGRRDMRKEVIYFIFSILYLLL